MVTIFYFGSGGLLAQMRLFDNYYCAAKRD